MMKLHKFVFNLFSENTYLVWDEESKETAVIDPGCSNELEESTLKEFIIEKKLNLKYMINTHCHVDHILGNAFIKKTFIPKFLAPKGDIFLLEEQENKPAYFGIKVERSPYPDLFINEEMKIFLNNLEISFCIHPDIHLMSIASIFLMIIFV